MEKKKLLEVLESHLGEELKEARTAKSVDPIRVKELEGLLMMYRFMPKRDYQGSEGEIIAPATLVELELGSTVAFYFIAPRGGGLITNVEGRPVQVITPQSPLGEALLGRRIGELVKIDIRGTSREYKVLSIR